MHIHRIDRHADRLALLLAEVGSRLLGALGAVVAGGEALDIGLGGLLILVLELAGAGDRHVARAVLDAEGRAIVAVQVLVLHATARSIHHDRVALEFIPENSQMRHAVAVDVGEDAEASLLKKCAYLRRELGHSLLPQMSGPGAGSPAGYKAGGRRGILRIPGYGGI